VLAHLEPASRAKIGPSVGVSRKSFSGKTDRISEISDPDRAAVGFGCDFVGGARWADVFRVNDVKENIKRVTDKKQCSKTP